MKENWWATKHSFSSADLSFLTQPRFFCCIVSSNLSFQLKGSFAWLHRNNENGLNFMVLESLVLNVFCLNFMVLKSYASRTLGHWLINLAANWIINDEYGNTAQITLAGRGLADAREARVWSMRLRSYAYLHFHPSNKNSSACNPARHPSFVSVREAQINK